MVLADLGRKLNSALSQFNRTSTIDQEVRLLTIFYGSFLNLSKALDALLKDVCAALLESDVNVKLVSSLRSKVRAKVKPIIEGGADKGKESNRRNLIQKVWLVLRRCKLPSNAR